MGMEPGIAGNWVQAIIFLGICVGWVSTYLYRVATKVGLSGGGRLTGLFSLAVSSRMRPHSSCTHAQREAEHMRGRWSTPRSK